MVSSTVLPAMLLERGARAVLPRAWDCPLHVQESLITLSSATVNLFGRNLQTSLQRCQRARCQQGSAALVALPVLALATQHLVAPAKAELGALCQEVSMPQAYTSVSRAG